MGRLINNLFFDSPDLGFERIFPLDPGSQNVADPRNPKHCINIVFFWSKNQSKYCKGSGSGGYSDHVFRAAAGQIFRNRFIHKKLNWSELYRIVWNYAELRASKVYLRWNPYSVLP